MAYAIADRQRRVEFLDYWKEMDEMDTLDEYDCLMLLAHHAKYPKQYLHWKYGEHEWRYMEQRCKQVIHWANEDRRDNGQTEVFTNFALIN